MKTFIQMKTTFFAHDMQLGCMLPRELRFKEYLSLMNTSNNHVSTLSAMCGGNVRHIKRRYYFLIIEYTIVFLFKATNEMHLIITTLSERHLLSVTSV